MNQETVVINHDGRTFAADDSHINYLGIRKALLSGDEDLAIELMDIPASIASAIGGTLITIENGQVKYDGTIIHNTCATAMLAMIDECRNLGVEPNLKPLANFLNRLMQNPSYRAVNELYGFIQASWLTILPDGRFLAYRKVKEEDGKLTDIYTGTFDNSVGQTVSVPRNTVDEDPNRTCSNGLHVCSEGYLSSYGTAPGDTCIIVAVDPADVVAVPTDYNNAKMRVCKFEVMGLRKGNPHSTVRELTQSVCRDYEPVHANPDDYDDDDYDNDYNDDTAEDDDLENDGYGWD